MSDSFYLQDTRQYVGNCILWWRRGGGYTTNLKEAEIFNREQVDSIYKMRPQSTRPWPTEYIDNKSVPMVDIQYIDMQKALEGRGGELI